MNKPDQTHSCCYLDCRQGDLCPLRINRECADVEDHPLDSIHSAALVLAAALLYVVAIFMVVVLVTTTLRL